MYLAGYDPNAASKFWKKLDDYVKDVKKYKQKSDVLTEIKRNLPQWTKTHPSSEDRYENLKKWSVDVKQKYKGVI